MSEIQPLTFDQRLEAQMAEILGADNMYFAYLELGYSPDRGEAARHYMENGGFDDFVRRHPLLLEDGTVVAA